MVTTPTPSRIPAEFELDRNGIQAVSKRYRNAIATRSRCACADLEQEGAPLLFLCPYGGKTGREYDVNRTDIYTLELQLMPKRIPI